jgi:WD40 repeat protein
VSADAEGVVRAWDLRAWKQEGEVNCGPHQANGVDLDPSGKFGFVASDDSTVKCIDLEAFRLDAELRGHEDAVLDVAVDVQNRALVTASTDTTFRTWN